ncbi:NADH:ubiquinone reductase (Na(+)-transporting) subunit E [Flavobacterium sp.]|jgi:Na+-transporting NADH:ubiquinone oxidoreductase subunit E|uniref:NADH:ubiquinone reductase (Na(+)-transporting) subunit E n=2 Tax=Flavobacterium sp. TaxID=239 RepID=UPI004047B9D0
MFEYINIFLKSMFIDNMVFAYFLGMCSYLAVSKKVSTAIGLGIAVTFVLVISAPLNYLIYKYVLEAGALAWLDPSLKTMDLSFLNLIIFIAVVATLVQLVEMIVEKFSPSLYNSLGIFLPLIAVNCAILGGSLFMQLRVDTGTYQNIGHVITFAFSSGIGWLIAIVALAAIREKMEYSNVLAPLRGLGITFILTGLMAVGFMSFGGIDINLLNKKPEAKLETPAPVVVETPVVDSVQVAVDSVQVDSTQIVK